MDAGYDSGASGGGQGGGSAAGGGSGGGGAGGGSAQDAGCYSHNPDAGDVCCSYLNPMGDVCTMHVNNCGQTCGCILDGMQLDTYCDLDIGNPCGWGCANSKFPDGGRMYYSADGGFTDQSDAGTPYCLC
jgi:hypothetical protein